jgi:hypothetical protein
MIRLGGIDATLVDTTAVPPQRLTRRQLDESIRSASNLRMRA